MRITSAFAYNYTRPLAIYVTANASLDRASASANDWGFTLLDWNNPFTISRNDAKLQQCVDRLNCELHITVGCQGAFTNNLNYFFSVQIGASYIPLLAGQDASGAALATDQDRYYAITASASGMQVRVDPCVGNAALFVNYMRSGIPTGGNNDASSMETNRAQVVTVPSAPNGRVVATVRGMTVKPAVYELTTWPDRPFEYFAPSTVNNTVTLWSAHAGSVTDGYIKINFLQARIPQAVTDKVLAQPTGSTSVLRYTVYWAYEPSDQVMWTLCGLNRTNVAMQQYAVSGANATLTFKVPSDTRRYTVNVLVQHTWKVGNVYTPSSRAYLAYRALTSILPGQLERGEPHGQLVAGRQLVQQQRHLQAASPQRRQQRHHSHPGQGRPRVCHRHPRHRRHLRRPALPARQEPAPGHERRH